MSAQVHSSKITKSNMHSFEDDVLNGVDEKLFRRIPKNCNHSMAWNIWHLTRIEDVTMNLLVGDKPQLFLTNAWYEKLGVKYRDTGNGMTDRDIVTLSNDIDIKLLKAYRLAVGKNTRKIVKQLKAEDFSKPVDKNCIEKIWKDKAVLKAGKGVVDYWSKKTVTGLLLMPPTRHCMVHLNECLKLKNKKI